MPKNTPKKEQIMAALRMHLDIPQELFPGGFSLSLSGDRELTVMGCRKILFYSNEEICLSVGKKMLSVKGKDLLCTAFGAGSVTLTGHIEALLFAENINKEEKI